jgi:hypothetical protein
MDDSQILDRIHALMEQEHQLRSSTDADTPVDEGRLTSLEETLDQCWDLLRQRRARREFGEPTEGVEARDPRTVEGYQQ